MSELEPPHGKRKCAPSSDHEEMTGSDTTGAGLSADEEGERDYAPNAKKYKPGVIKNEAGINYPCEDSDGESTVDEWETEGESDNVPDYQDYDRDSTEIESSDGADDADDLDTAGHQQMVELMRGALYPTEEEEAEMVEVMRGALYPTEEEEAEMVELMRGTLYPTEEEAAIVDFLRFLAHPTDEREGM